MDDHKCHCFLRAQMKLLYAQSNLERVLEQENFDHLTFQYYDNSQIIPEIGMTNARGGRLYAPGGKKLYGICTEF